MWFLRALGVWSLLAAMIALTIDGTKSLAGQGKLVMTPLGQTWYQLSSASLNTAQAGIERHVAHWLWDPVILAILQVPTWVFFTALGLLLYWLGRKRTVRSLYSN